MNKKIIKYKAFLFLFVTIICGIMVLGITRAASGSLTTLFNQDRNFHGNMFDVTAVNSLTITSFDVNINVGTTTVSVYTKGNTYVGGETNAGLWALMGSATVTSAGLNNPTHVPIGGFTIPAGQTYGFYVTVTPTFDANTSVDLFYTAGGNTYSNGDMVLTAGIGVGGLFGDPNACADATRGFGMVTCLFPNRSWNGTIYYDLIPPNVPLPTPQPLVLLPPPPAPLCTAMNFDKDASLRAVSKKDSMETNCRMLVADRQYLYWNGGPLTNAGEIGNQSILDMDVTQAVDVFSPVGRTHFEGDVAICLRGSGTLYFFAASQAPRVPQAITMWTTPSYPDFTCGTLYEPGTLVLVAHVPKKM